MGDEVSRSCRVQCDVGERKKESPNEFSPVVRVVVRKSWQAFEEQDSVRNNNKSKR